MPDLTSKLAFFEARLTLLERKLETFLNGGANRPALIGKRRIECNESGLIMTRAYAPEQTDAGDWFCWIGNDGPLQFLVPVCLQHSATCKMILLPHAAIDFSAVEVIANDRIVPTKLQRTSDGKLILAFPIPANHALDVSISLLNVRSLRPQDTGESADQRLLSTKFFAMEIYPN